MAPFVKLARTIRRHRAGNLAAIRLGLSNGRLERLNSRIRVISHRSIGFHSADPLIALVYLRCSRVVIHLPRWTFTTESLGAPAVSGSLERNGAQPPAS